MEYPPSVSKFHRVLYHRFPKMTSHFQKNCRRQNRRQLLIHSHLPDFSFLSRTDRSISTRMQKLPKDSTFFPCFPISETLLYPSGGHHPAATTPANRRPGSPPGRRFCLHDGDQKHLIGFRFPFQSICLSDGIHGGTAASGNIPKPLAFRSP